MRLATFAAVLLLALTSRATAWQAPEGDAGADEQAVKAARLGSDGPALLEFFRQRAKRSADPARVKALVGKLGDKEREARDKAAGELVSVGMPAVPLLRQAASNADQAEAAELARGCLRAIEGEEGAAVTVAAARLLAHHNPDGAADALLAFVPYAESADVVNEVVEVLGRVAVSDGKPAPALLKALEDESPARRAVAARVLSRAGSDHGAQAVKALLKDPKPTVRFHAALMLARRHEADAIPVLIGLLADLPRDQRRQCEEYLADLAGEWRVEVPEGDGPFLRKLRREAWLAWWKASEDDTLLDEFRRRTFTDAEREKARELIGQLGKGSSEERDRAAAALVACGRRAVPLLLKVVAAEKGDEKVREAAQRCLDLIERDGDAPLPAVAVRLVALRKSEGAAEVLLAYVPYAGRDEAGGALAEALPALAVRDGKADPAFVKALTDALPARRIAAAEALAAHPAQHDVVRKLFADADPLVRLKAALALAGHGDRDAVPQLIALLGELPADQAWEAEEYLVRMAGDKRPRVSLGAAPNTRKKASEAWAAWWKDNGDAVQLVRRDSTGRKLGYTLIVEAQNNRTGRGRILEVDGAGKTRWEVGNLQNPIDAEVIAENRLLIVEAGLNRVTECDFKGKVKWQTSLQQPLAAQRLRNGRTFVACRNHFLELDRTGKQVFRLNRNGEYFMAAGRLKDGTFAYVNNQNYTYVRIDRNGKELNRYQVPRDPRGGNRYFNILPSGNVLVSNMQGGTIVEYNKEGKELREVKAVQPGMAAPLSGGRFLVAQYNRQRVVELDRNGKEVREFRVENGRPYRASRR